jgi:hypothetical protein
VSLGAAEIINAKRDHLGSLPHAQKLPSLREGSAVLFGRLGLLVDCGLGDFGGLVRGLFLIQRFLQQFDGVIETEFFRLSIGVFKNSPYQRCLPPVRLGCPAAWGRRLWYRVRFDAPFQHRVRHRPK